MESIEAPMASDTIHIEVDGTVKAEAEEALAGLGLTVSDAVRLLLARVAAEKVLPFERLSGNGTKPQATDAPESKEPTNSDRKKNGPMNWRGSSLRASSSRPKTPTPSIGTPSGLCPCQLVPMKP